MAAVLTLQCQVVGWTLCAGGGEGLNGGSADPAASGFGQWAGAVFVEQAERVLDETKSDKNISFVSIFCACVCVSGGGGGFSVQLCVNGLCSNLSESTSVTLCVIAFYSNYSRPTCVF